MSVVSRRLVPGRDDEGEATPKLPGPPCETDVLRPFGPPPGWLLSLFCVGGFNAELTSVEKSCGRCVSKAYADARDAHESEYKGKLVPLSPQRTCQLQQPVSPNHCYPNKHPVLEAQGGSQQPYPSLAPWRH